MAFHPNDTLAALPLVVLSLFAMTLLLLDLFGACKNRLLWGLSACVFAWAFSCTQFYLSDDAFGGMLYVDGFSTVMHSIVLGGTAITLLLNYKKLEAQRAESGIEVDTLLLLSAAGALAMLSASHLVVLFLGFELLSVSVYALTAIARKERASSEGALKYFILGAFSSAFLLYGMALVYGATGSMHYSEIALNISSSNTMLLVGVGMLIFGFGFKVSLVPFHVWTPDVYQGAPASISGFMAVVVKAAAFGSFLRLMYVPFGELGEVWSGLLWILAVLTMCVGNLAALRQNSLKRMLAYSSVAHAGYALMGFLSFESSAGAEAVVFYLAVYSLMTLAAFGVVVAVTAGSDAQYSDDSIESFSGIGFTHPYLGFVMTIALLSLAGIPPLAGFVGKLYLFSATVSAGYTGLAIIAALNSVVSLYYYLRVLVTMYFNERSLEWLPEGKLEWAPRTALGLVTLGTLVCGVLSYSFYPAVALAIKSLG